MLKAASPRVSVVGDAAALQLVLGGRFDRVCVSDIQRPVAAASERLARPSARRAGVPARRVRAAAA